MYIGTHTCLPIVAITAVDIVRVAQKKEKVLPARQLWLIALAGILPDILWPHLSMRMRLSSWTHTIWFLAVLFPVILFLAKKYIKKNPVRFTIIFWLAAAIHIFTDGISGGISLYYPIEKTVGNYYISHPTWFMYDMVFISSALVLLLVRYKIEIHIQMTNNTNKK